MAKRDVWCDLPVRRALQHLHLKRKRREAVEIHAVARAQEGQPAEFRAADRIGISRVEFRQEQVEDSGFLIELDEHCGIDVLCCARFSPSRDHHATDETRGAAVGNEESQELLCRVHQRGRGHARPARRRSTSWGERRPSPLSRDLGEPWARALRPRDEPTRRPGIRRGIRIGSARDGKVTAFIPDPCPYPYAGVSTLAEGVTADAQGNVYGADFLMDVRTFVKK